MKNRKNCVTRRNPTKKQGELLKVCNSSKEGKFSRLFYFKKRKQIPNYSATDDESKTANAVLSSIY